jgi:hypothetical protein
MATLLLFPLLLLCLRLPLPQLLLKRLASTHSQLCSAASKITPEQQHHHLSAHHLLVLPCDSHNRFLASQHLFRQTSRISRSSKEKSFHDSNADTHNTFIHLIDSTILPFIPIQTTAWRCATAALFLLCVVDVDAV